MISHEATILKAAAWCLLIPPSPQIPVKQLLEETFGEAEENCFQDFETLLIKKELFRVLNGSSHFELVLSVNA